MEKEGGRERGERERETYAKQTQHKRVIVSLSDIHTKRRVQREHIHMSWRQKLYTMPIFMHYSFPI